MALLSKSSTSLASLFAAILCFALVAAFTTMFSTSTVSACGFTKQLEQQMAEDLAKPAPPNSGFMAGRASSYAPIRITFSTLDVDDSSKYCTTAGESKPDMQGGTKTCTADDVLTTDKRNRLINDVLPQAQELLQEVFSVISLTGNLLVTTTDTHCNYFNIPTAHKTTGVPSTDFILYVAAAPTDEGNVAWAATCQESTDSPSRAVVGRANFGPRYLSDAKMPLKDIIATGVHEILHAMGYNYNKFNSRGIVGTRTFRGISKYAITSDRALTRAREWAGCGSLPGVELENEGGSGTQYSHPDRRVYKDDVMAGASGEALSVVTIAVMEDLGVYQGNYTAQQNMVTGKGWGCGFADSACTTAAGGLDKAWCTGTADGCSSNLKAYGPCSDPFLTDECRYVNPYSNKNCYDTSRADVSDNGDTFHEDSRCFDTNNLKASGSGTTYSGNYRCLKAQCYSNILSVAIGRNSVDYQVCNADSTATFSGYTGSVICPDISYMCESLTLLGNSSGGSDPLETKKAIVYGKTNRATDWLYSTKLLLTVSGSNWNNVVDNHYSELFSAMQGDVAQRLDLESQQVWVKEVSHTTTSVTFTITINEPALSSTSVRGSFSSYLGRQGWMPRTAGLYSSKSGSSDKAVLGAAGASDKPENLCTTYMPSFEDDTKCNGLIAGIAVAAVAFIAICVVTIYCCCCKYVDPPVQMDRSVKYQVKPRG